MSCSTWQRRDVEHKADAVSASIFLHDGRAFLMCILAPWSSARSGCLPAMGAVVPDIILRYCGKLLASEAGGSRDVGLAALVGGGRGQGVPAFAALESVFDGHAAGECFAEFYGTPGDVLFLHQHMEGR
jgi:hypothetical protein